jgi:glycyl-tRNA synthetase beta chain
MADFLLEIGLEEVPARMIAGAEAELGRRVSDLLKRERLLAPEANSEANGGANGAAKVTTYSTPRRLAVLAEGVLAKQADTEEVLTGPSWKVAFKDSEATPAAHAFAKKAGVGVGELKKVIMPKGEYVGATMKRTGRTAHEILAAELPKEVLAIYWAKNMYWLNPTGQKSSGGDPVRVGRPERFVRPVRWVVALMDAEVVPLEIAGIAAGNASRGHRVLHGEAPVVIDAANAYKEALRAAYVVCDGSERRQMIRKALDTATRTVPDARWREDEALVETVTHLTEWPSVVLGDFEAEYLELPEEVLVTVMRDHQKYFAVEDANGKLAPHFLAVLNTQADAEGAAIIRHGNARVLRARFKDAQFFWNLDQKTTLAERMESLKSVTFQKELGSYYWKTEQNLAVANALATTLKSADFPFDEAALFKAVELAKTDLTAELVKEFTELQGVIGGLYARAQGLDERAALAIYEQYKPASTEDAIPVSVEGQLLGLADRMQTIVAMFGIGNAPTGSKDPFALRRAANAVVKILAVAGLPLTVGDVLNAACEVGDQTSSHLSDKNKDVAKVGHPEGGNKAQVEAFLRERVQFYLKDVRGFAYDVVNAVMAVSFDDLRDAVARAEALTEARGSEDFVAVSAAFKRIKNILRQAEEKGYQSAQPKLGQSALEAIDLWQQTNELSGQVAKLREERKYGEALAMIATLRPAVDKFFNKVMVLDPDPTLRGAHLGLIDGVQRSFSGIADFGEIVTA